MRRLQSGISALMAVALLASCANDPTGDLRGTPSVISPTLFFTVIALGGNKSVDVQLHDEQGNALAGSISAASSNPTAVSVEEDTTFRTGLGASRLTTRFTIKALLPDSARITLSAAGVRDTVVSVIVNPTGQAVTTLNGAAAGDTTTVSANIGDVITLNGTGNITFNNSTTVTFGTLQAVVTSVAGNGASLTFIPVPGSGYSTVLGMAAPVAATVTTTIGYGPSLQSITFSSSSKLTVPPVASLPAVFSTATPNTNEALTVTAAGFKFLPNAFAEYGGKVQTIDSISADSSTVYMRTTQPGAADVVTFSNIALDFLTGAPLSNIPSVNTLAVSATVNSLAGTDAIATAPLVSMPPSLKSIQINDTYSANGSADCNNGPSGIDCQIYAIVVPADGDYAITANWNSLADLGLYISDAADADQGLGTDCDQHGNGATAHPESCTATLTAGTWYIHLGTYAVFYGPPNNVDPTSITIDIAAQ